MAQNRKQIRVTISESTLKLLHVMAAEAGNAYPLSVSQTIERLVEVVRESKDMRSQLSDAR